MTAVGLVESCKLCQDRREPHDYHVEDNWISHGCQFPAEPQAHMTWCNCWFCASIRPPEYRSRMSHIRYPRHPFDGHRPDWSGYCVIDSCNCTCHVGDDVTIDEFQVD